MDQVRTTMEVQAWADDLFLTDLSQSQMDRVVDDAVQGADDGELFLEVTRSEAVSFRDSRVHTASFDMRRGFGLRSVSGEMSGFAHSETLDMGALSRARDAVRESLKGRSGTLVVGPQRPNRSLYDALDPIPNPVFEEKIAQLASLDQWLRDQEPRIRQVNLSLAGGFQAVRIIRPGGEVCSDVRPLVRVGVAVTLADGTRQETGSSGGGGRYAFSDLLKFEAEGLEGKGIQVFGKEALRIARVAMESIPAPAGETTVVLGPGWPGILLHEAVGHGLEGDFNRKKASAFSGLMGQRVAAPGVTVVDDGSIPLRRGSLNIDDEGTPTRENVLIEDGILVGYLQDRLNARLMGVAATGNGRRESAAHLPMPRMTNTFMRAGRHDPKEIIASVKKGVYAVGFGGGQVDIVSGKFVFSCTEAYEIEDGKVGAPLKGAMLIGSGHEVLKKVSMIGRDLALDPGIGVCGKNGQGVPVGVGQPTVRIDDLTVGGTGA